LQLPRGAAPQRTTPRRPHLRRLGCRATAAGRPGAPPAHADYAAKAGDSAVLQRPLKAELLPDEIQHVFGYPRNLKDRYTLGAVLGAGSFGVVRECVDRRSGRRFAVKSINKVPKNARATPRYLLKIQTEVDAMQQLGGSLDAVFLQVGGGGGGGVRAGGREGSPKDEPCTQWLPLRKRSHHGRHPLQRALHPMTPHVPRLQGQCCAHVCLCAAPPAWRASDMSPPPPLPSPLAPPAGARDPTSPPPHSNTRAHRTCLRTTLRCTW
jgi:hypothetical protein